MHVVPQCGQVVCMRSKGRILQYISSRGGGLMATTAFQGGQIGGTGKARDIEIWVEEEDRSIVEEYRYMKHNREVEKEERSCKKPRQTLRDPYAAPTSAVGPAQVPGGTNRGRNISVRRHPVQSGLLPHPRVWRSCSPERWSPHGRGNPIQ